MKKSLRKMFSVALSMAICAVGLPFSDALETQNCAAAEETLESSWTSMSIGGGGFVTGIITGKSAIYARTDVGGAYRYDDGKWTQLMNFISPADVGLLSVEGMAVDPTDDDKVYMITGCGYFSNGKTVVFRSDDGGETFEQTDVTSLIRVHGNAKGRQNGERIAVDPNSPNILYCGGRTGGLIRSTDYGETWSMVTDLGIMNTEVNWPSWTSNKVMTNENSTGIVSVVFDENSGTPGTASERIFVAASVVDETNIFVSEDGGSTFAPLSEDLPTNYYPQRMKLDSDGDLLITYADTTGDGAGEGTICRYNITSGTVDTIGLPEDRPVGDVVCKSDDADSLFACTRGMWLPQKWSTGATVYGDIFYSSTDGGKTWTYLGIGNDNPITNNGCSWIYDKAIHWAGCLAINPQNENQAFVISGNGIFTCNDMWEAQPDFYFNSSGLEETVCYGVVSIPGVNKVFSVIADYDGFVHTSSDTYAEQFSPTMGSTKGLAYNPHNTDVMVRIAFGTGGFYSLDGAATWTALENPSEMKNGYAAITTTEDGKNRIFRSPEKDTGVYYSDDYGASWTQCEGISGEVGFAVDSVNPNCIYAANSGNFYYSTDYGKTFSSTPLSGNSSLIIHAYGTAGKVYVATNKGLMVTLDGGKTFSNVSSAVQSASAVGVGKEKNPGGPLTIFIWGVVNDQLGAFCSTDEGATWTRINDDQHQFGGLGNGNFVVGDMNTFGTMYMSTVGLGVICHQFKNVPTPQLKGDVNLDGTVTVLDIVMLQKYLLAKCTLTAEQGEMADMIEDSCIDAFDLAALKRYVTSQNPAPENSVKFEEINGSTWSIPDGLAGKTLVCTFSGEAGYSASFGYGCWDTTRNDGAGDWVQDDSTFLGNVTFDENNEASVSFVVPENCYNMQIQVYYYADHAVEDASLKSVVCH